MLQERGEVSEAARIIRVALEVLRCVLGAEPPNALASASMFVSVLQELGELSGAARISCEALEVLWRVLIATPPNMLPSASKLA